MNKQPQVVPPRERLEKRSFGFDAARGIITMVAAEEQARAFGGGPALGREYDLRGRLSAQWFSRRDGRKPCQVAVGGRTIVSLDAGVKKRSLVFR